VPAKETANQKAAAMMQDVARLFEAESGSSSGTGTCDSAFIRRRRPRPGGCSVALELVCVEATGRKVAGVTVLKNASGTAIWASTAPHAPMLGLERLLVRPHGRPSQPHFP